MSEESDVIYVDLKKAKKDRIDESFLSMFGGAVKKILQRMFGNPSKLPIKVRGNKKDVQAFVDTLESEKEYMETFRDYGLDNPKTYRSKSKLERAVNNFEKETGIDWPFGKP